MRRQGVGHTVQLFDVLQGTAPLLLVNRWRNPKKLINTLYPFAIGLQEVYSENFRAYWQIVVIRPELEGLSLAPKLSIVYDPEGALVSDYPSVDGAGWLIRLEGYIGGWHSDDYQSAGLHSYLTNVFSPVHQVEANMERTYPD